MADIRRAFSKIFTSVFLEFGRRDHRLQEKLQDGDSSVRVAHDRFNGGRVTRLRRTTRLPVTQSPGEPTGSFSHSPCASALSSNLNPQLIEKPRMNTDN